MVYLFTSTIQKISDIYVVSYGTTTLLLHILVEYLKYNETREDKYWDI